MAGAGGCAADFPARTLGKKKGPFPAPARPPYRGRRLASWHPDLLPLAAEEVRPGQATGTNEVAALTRTMVQTSALNTETATC